MVQIATDIRSTHATHALLQISYENYYLIKCIEVIPTLEATWRLIVAIRHAIHGKWREVACGQAGRGNAVSGKQASACENSGYTRRLNWTIYC